MGIRARSPGLGQERKVFSRCLGFRVLWADATEWRLVERDGVRVVLGQCPNDLPPAQLGSHNRFGCVEVDGVNAFHAEIVARGAIDSVSEDRHYRMRETVVTTVDGHRIVIAQEIAGRPA